MKELANVYRTVYGPALSERGLESQLHITTILRFSKETVARKTAQHQGRVDNEVARQLNSLFSGKFKFTKATIKRLRQGGDEIT
ncbi:MAG: hypothetical protein WC449_05415 [Candidatus Paceibacterota bacterium]